MQPTKRPRILSLIPPMTQLNVPYPATAYLTGFLRDRGYPARQADLAIQLVLDLLSPSGLETLREAAEALPRKRRSASLKGFLNEFPRYLQVTGPTLAFLQGRDPSLAQRIVSRSFLPEGPDDNARPLGECLKLCVSDLAHAVFRYCQAPKRPANIMAS